ncbi:hypothetical protein [Streptomyces griseoflavus]|uniref:hypothetical protein n=1 Tax=Streptomyces griseoflavus TaxID=35619 RepID=UPI0033AB9668
MTHEQLAALIDSASSEGASLLATKLSKASSTITKIGDDLMTYVKGLEWQGEGGDAFRDWGGQSAAATLRLGQYAEVSSRWMATVAQAVAEAKAAMPATSETTQAKADLADARKTIAATQEPGARNDPDARKLAQTAQSDATAAQQRMEAARAEAIQQLRKLAQTYEYSAHQVNSVEPPTFAPPAQHLEAKEWRAPQGQDVAMPGGYSATTSSYVGTGGSEGQAGAPVRASSSTYLPSSGDTSTFDREQSRPAAMNIDGVTAVPDTRSTTPANAAPTQTVTGSRPDVGHAQQPVIVPQTVPGRGGVPGAAGPQQTPPTVRSTLVSGQGTPSGGRLRVPGDPGIVGGRPVLPGAGKPATALPRGTVIGADLGHGRPSQGQAPMGRAVSPGVPSGGSPAAGQNGTSGGRRLASETGGVVGSRPVQPGRSGPRPFTPGGAGLVRQSNAGESAHGSMAGRATSGMQPGHQSSSRRDNRQEQTQRPGYLAEDEETWARRNQRAVPPVVD